MKNKKHYYNNLNEDDKGMHLFYMMENIEDCARYIGNEMSVDNSLYGARMNILDEINERLEALCDRIRNENNKKKTENAISYSI